MIDRHVDAIYQVYIQALKAYNYLFKNKKKFWLFIIVESILFATGAIFSFFCTGNFPIKYLIFSIIGYGLCLISAYFVSRRIDKAVRIEYESISGSYEHDILNCLRGIAVHRIKKYLVEKEHDSEYRIKQLINNLYRKSDEHKFTGLPTLGIIFLLIIPFWNSIIDRCVYEADSIEAVLELVKKVSIILVFLAVIVMFFHYAKRFIYTLINTKSRQFRDLACLINDEILLPLEYQATKTNSELFYITKDIRFLLADIALNIKNMDNQKRMDVSIDELNDMYDSLHEKMS